MKRTNKEEPRKLDDWEWDTLVAAWRYYEHRSSITAFLFPAEIVSRYWGGNWDTEDRYRIARQFSEIDHGRRGVEDWKKDEDGASWRKFYAFCRRYCIGFYTLQVQTDEGPKPVKAFYCDGRWYPVGEYVANPFAEFYINPGKIVEDTK